jgi:hypothetical protein
MPPMGKELQRPPETPESIAIREVENYIEKVEKSTENSVSDNQNTQQGGVTPNVSDLVNRPISVPKIDPNLKKIVLPLTEKDIVAGFKSNVFEGIRWLSEWCVMMIRKYPGRVFYSSSKENTYD